MLRPFDLIEIRMASVYSVLPNFPLMWMRSRLGEGAPNRLMISSSLFTGMDAMLPILMFERPVLDTAVVSTSFP